MQPHDFARPVVLLVSYIATCIYTLIIIYICKPCDAIISYRILSPYDSSAHLIIIILHHYDSNQVCTVHVHMISKLYAHSKAIIINIMMSCNTNY